MTNRIILLVLSLAFLTSDCFADDPHPRTLRVMTYNTWYVFAKGKEQDTGAKFIQSHSPDVVALQELTNIQPETLHQLASQWEHGYSSLLKTSGFSVGLTSRWPIELIEKRLDKMHHGYLHANTNGVHYFVVHLSPFDWKVRMREAEVLLSKINPLLEKNAKIIVLGDFNAHSACDAQWLSKNKTLLEKLRQSDKKNDHVENLRDGQFDFSVMKLFLDTKLADTSEQTVQNTAARRSTFSTGIWSDKKTAPATGERIDYILASPSMLARVKNSSVIREGIVNRISDHYPVITDFRWTQ